MHHTAELPTDEQLSADAERLAQTALELSAMALRWAARFPTSTVIADAVDRFLEGLPTPPS
jgi:hypothetical protein